MIEKRYEVQQYEWYKKEWILKYTTGNYKKAKREINWWRERFPDSKYRIVEIAITETRKVLDL